MGSFKDVVGHKNIIEYIQNAVNANKVSHAYILNGERGSGKKMLATLFAETLLCEEQGSSPCNKCHSCKQTDSGNHPDVIWVQHEKANLITVSEIREQVCNTMDIKPFASPYKIYIVPEAEKMNEQAQNALLKTIEEPPEYGVVILLTSNITALLPTIQSRCLIMEFRPLSNSIVEEFLRTQGQVPDYLAKASAAFAQGNLGKAMRYAKSEDFIETKDMILNLLRHVQDMTVSDMLENIKELGTRKDEVRDYIDLMELWYRDVLIFKATKNINQLIFQDESTNIAKEASLRGYEQIEHIMQAFEKAKVRLKANVNFEVTMELMLMALKD